MLNMNRASAANRPASPSASKAGKTSSAAVPSQAAITGDNSGTAYSYSNSASVDSQDCIFNKPDLKNIHAT